MRTRDGDSGTEAHQFGEHFGTLDHRYATRKRCCDLGILAVDGAGNYHHVDAVDILRLMAQQDTRTLSLETCRDSIGLEVRALHRIALRQQHFGNTTHTGTTDADEVDTLDTPHAVPHLPGFL
jgi:hypothetical protein